MLTVSQKDGIRDFFSITAGCAALIVGNYFFKFPNRFVYGGVTGLSVILADVLPVSTGTANLVLNVLLLVLGLLIVGRKFGIKTIYATVLMTVSFSVLEKIFPMNGPLTDQRTLEFAISLLLTAFGSAMLFHSEASSGGTDVPAMIIKKFTGQEIGWALVFSDAAIVIGVFFVFDIETALYSSCGLLIKSLLIDTSVARLNRSRMVSIICDDPDPVCEYIIGTIKKDATYHEATGAYSKSKKFIVLCVLKPKSERKLRRYIRDHVPGAFVLVSDSSSIFGKGFSSFSE